MPSNKDGLAERHADLHISFGQLMRQLALSMPSIARTSLVRAPSLRSVKGTLTGYARWGFTPGGLLESAAQSYPNRVALIDEVSQLTYTELREVAMGFAGALKKVGLTEGDRLAMVTRNSRVPVMALCACNYLGLIPLVINPMSSPGQMKLIVEEDGADAICTDVEYADAFVDVDKPIFLGFGADHGIPESIASSRFVGDVYSYAEATAAASDVELPWRSHQFPTVIMSSGTSGKPKGVVRAVPRTPQVLQSIFPKVPWRVGGVIQMTSNFFHAWGWLNLNIIFATSSAMVLRRYFDPREAMDDINRYGVTGIVSSGIFLRDLIKIPGPERQTVEFIIASGNVIPPHLVHEINERFGLVLCNFYGSTEHGPIAVASAEELEENPHRAGKPACGVHTAILDDEGRELPDGKIGTIYSANSESMIGYLSASDPALVRDHMLCTGDLGYIDDEGFLHVVGRADDMVIKGGENVYPRELEDLLVRQPEVAEVYVKGIRGEIISTVNCYIVPADDADIDNDFVTDLVAQNLAQHNQPDNIVWMKELPRNANGKVVSRLLPEPPEQA